MTNKLIIENFLIFDHVEIDVNRYTVFIGPQASGKSVVAKILYLFYQLPKKCFSLLDKKDIVKNTIQEMTQEFGKVFLERLWRAHTFSIRLQTASGFLEYKYKPNDDIVFSMSENYLSLISSLEKDFSKEKKDEKGETYFSLNLYRIMRDKFHAAEWGLLNGGGSASFIPAGRSYFTSLSKLVYTAMVNDVEIDYFVTMFGSDYEKDKAFYSRHKSIQDIDIQLKLLKGIYTIKGPREFIHIQRNNHAYDIPVADASSGQQELLPILLRMFSSPRTFYMIEEPEAHIYPDSQDLLIRYIISRRVQNDSETAFLFTTHSPYVLTTINNLAYAGILEARFRQEDNKKALVKLGKIYPQKERIAQGSLSAYYFDENKITSIVDPKTGIIDAKKFDAISDKTDNKFSSLLRLELKEIM